MSQLLTFISGNDNSKLIQVVKTDDDQYYIPSLRETNPDVVFGSISEIESILDDNLKLIVPHNQDK